MSKLDEILTPIEEALHNLSDEYPEKNSEVAQRSLGRLWSYLNYQPKNKVIVMHDNPVYFTIKT